MNDIKRIRTDHGLSIEEFAKMLGADPKYITDMENGNIIISEAFRRYVSHTFEEKDSYNTSGISDELINMIIKFRDERNWLQFHTPKDLAISISLEASELLEIFQWSGKDTWVSEKKESLQEELADILMYCILLSDVLGLDLEEIIQKKLTANKAKYPISDSYGSAKKYTEFE